MSDKVKLAFVGTGDVFLKYYLPEAIEQEIYDITAICDIALDRAQRVADFVGGAEAYGDYNEMLERSDAEMIAIVTPPPSHYQLALDGLEAGRHVYVEKPFCRHLDQANHLLDTAQRKGVHLMAAPTILLDPPNMMMRDLIREGAIGKVAFAVSPSFQLGGAAPGYFDRFQRQLKFSNIDLLERPEEKTDAAWYYQKGGGPVYDLAVYSITQMTGLIGPVRRVVAFSGTVNPHRLLMGGTEEARQIDVTEDDNTSFLLDMGDARFVYINAAWHGGGSRSQGMEIIGSEGTITTSGSGDLVTRTREATVHLYQNERREWEDIPAEGELWWIPTGMTHLAHCIAENRQPDITIEHARHVVEVMEKVYVAAETGRAQEITTTF